MTVVYGTLFKDSIGTGREIRHIGVKPFFIDLLEFAALLQFFHSFVYLLQEFLVVLIEGKGQVFRFRIADIDDVEFILPVLGQEIISNWFIDDRCRRTTDLEFHDGFRVIIELLDIVALFFSVFSPVVPIWTAICFP